MDDLVQLKVRLMALEASQRKMDKFLRSLAKAMEDPVVNKALKTACREYLDVFVGLQG